MASNKGVGYKDNKARPFSLLFLSPSFFLLRIARVVPVQVKSEPFPLFLRSWENSSVLEWNIETLLPPPFFSSFHVGETF